MSHGKQFTLYSHYGGANGWKVAYVLSELGLTYELVFLEFDKKEQKSPEFLKLNPNGRIPALIDHGNNDFVLWESCAILLYLVDRYDKEHKISASTDEEKALQNQWLFFQASGQGPYFGQFFYFNFASPEKYPTAIARYYKEAERVFGVLNDALSKQQWLVGDKMSIADISFLPWNDLAFDMMLGPDYPLTETFPAVSRWHTAMSTVPAIKAAIEARAAIQPQR